MDNEQEIEEILKKKFQEVQFISVTAGYRSASKVILNMINDGKSLDEIKSYCEQTVNDCNSIDKVKNL
jgi:radical SAM superfamily enzyme YgiQ (UPF0313 family)